MQQLERSVKQLWVPVNMASFLCMQRREKNLVLSPPLTLQSLLDPGDMVANQMTVSPPTSSIG